MTGNLLYNSTTVWSFLLKVFLLGILASLFFASSFVLNRAMELAGGSWVWSASLRYFFMVLPLLLIVMARGNLGGLIREMRAHLWTWLLWSTVGFGLFYAPICFAAAFGPGWLVASTWQLTLVAGSLLVPFIAQTRDDRPSQRSIPLQSILISLVILVGVVIMQLQQAEQTSLRQVLLGVLPVVIAAFAYPLGNRKMMAVCAGRLDTFQRVLGMTIASLPFWLILGLGGLGTVGLPSTMQVVQTMIVALFSGVIATLLFFGATDLTGGDVRQLAAVEATQAGEVVFALVGEIVLLGGHVPSPIAFAGMAIVIGGMIVHSLTAHKPTINVAQ